jgi:hypothetical protein
VDTGPGGRATPGPAGALGPPSLRSWRGLACRPARMDSFPDRGCTASGDQLDRNAPASRPGRPERQHPWRAHKVRRRNQSASGVGIFIENVGIGHQAHHAAPNWTPTGLGERVLWYYRLAADEFAATHALAPGSDTCGTSGTGRGPIILDASTPTHLCCRCVPDTATRQDRYGP